MIKMKLCVPVTFPIYRQHTAQIRFAMLCNIHMWELTTGTNKLTV